MSRQHAAAVALAGLRASVDRMALRRGDLFVGRARPVEVRDYPYGRVVLGIDERTPAGEPVFLVLTPNEARRLVLALEAEIRAAEARE